MSPNHTSNLNRRFLLLVGALLTPVLIGATTIIVRTVVSSINPRFASVLHHRDRVASAQFSPDGASVVTASHDGIARVWKLNGTLLATLQSDSMFAPSVRFQGGSILTAFDVTVQVRWGTDSGARP